jgi:hypothetical protein
LTLPEDGGNLRLFSFFGTSMDGPSASTRKYRQAAAYYVLLAALYDGAVWQLQQHGLLGRATPGGPTWVYLVAGALIAAAVFYFLWFRENRWVARVVAVAGTVRLVALMDDAFLKVQTAPVDASAYVISRAFYIAAFVIVAINVWLMARAGWDL